MPAATTVLVFAGASLTLLLIPGPAVIYIVTRSGAHGARAGLVTVAGAHTASLVHVVAAVVGLSALLVASATAFTFVKIVGGLYLVYLGVRVLRGRAVAHDDAAASLSRRRLFAEAFTVNLLNPKVALFFLAFLPQFVRRDHGPVWAQTLMLGAVYIALGLCSDSAYALTAAGLSRRFRWVRRPRRATRIVEGSTLIGLGVAALAFPHRSATSS